MILPPNCWDRNCKHYQGIMQPNDTEMTEKPYCRAYPEGIPNDIAYGDDKHLEVREDQKNAIIYEEEENEK